VFVVDLDRRPYGQVDRGSVTEIRVDPERPARAPGGEAAQMARVRNLMPDAT